MHRRVRMSIDAHFGGQISRRRERGMREHLPDCDACRGYYRRHLMLASIDPATLSAEERLARGLGLAAAGAPTASWWVKVSSLAAVGCCLLLIPAALDEQQEYTARGLTAGSDFVVYRADAEGFSTVQQEIRGDDELAFAYFNQYGLPYLMIFGIDGASEVFWYYPAWTDPNETPRALPIVRTDELRELPDAVRHRLGAGELRLIAVFLSEPLTVLDVETRLRPNTMANGVMPFEGAIVRSRRLRVEGQ